MNRDAIVRIQLAAEQLGPRLIRDLKEIVLPPRICGVYFLIEDQDIVYVGQSADVVRRVNEHLDRGKKKSDTAMYLPCSLGELDKIESHFIDAFRPRYNNTRRRMGTAAYVRHVLQANGPLTLDEIIKLAPEHGVWAQCSESMKTNITRELQRDPLIHRCGADDRFRSTCRATGAAEVQ